MTDSHWLDESSDPLGDDEYPDDDAWDDESAELMPCPECGADIYEETQRCPHCGSYITLTSSPLAGRSWWWIALGLLGLLAVILALAFGSI